MNKITAPINVDTTGKSVKDLQDALLLMLDNSIFQDSDTIRKIKREDFIKEMSTQKYGPKTNALVQLFQRQSQISETGEVNDQTANAINEALLKEGIIEASGEQDICTVSGQICHSDNSPFSGVIVQAFHESREKGLLSLGQPSNTDNKGNYTIRYNLLPNTPPVNLRISILEGNKFLKSSDTIPNAKAQQRINLIIWQTRWIQGQVMMENGLPAAGITLRLSRIGFGGNKTNIQQDKEVITTENGSYTLSYNLPDKLVCLEVYAVQHINADSETEIALSKTLYVGSEERTQINLVAPASIQPQQAEYQRLNADLSPHIGNMQNLADAHENTTQQDITLLNRKTYWDARLIALAAAAARLSADAGVIKFDLSQEELYGLLRAGLPMDKLQLAQVSEEAVVSAWTKAKETGVISNSLDVEKTKAKFARFAAATKLGMTIPGANSTYRDLLESCGLDLMLKLPENGNLLKNKMYLEKSGNKIKYKILGPLNKTVEGMLDIQMDGELTAKILDSLKPKILEETLKKGYAILSNDVQEKFARFYFNYQGDTTTFWEKASEKAGISDSDIQILQKQSKLSYLTFHNPALIAHLQTNKKISDITQLVSNDFHQSNSWKTEINALASEESSQLKDLIPEVYLGNTDEERLNNYAEDMARKVRISYSTQVVSRLIEQNRDGRTDAANLFQLNEASATVALLNGAATRGFKLGQTPVESFLKANPDIAHNEVTKENLKTLQRVYQITPSNEAMSALMQLGLTSAYDVVAFPYDVFLKRYGSRFPSMEQAELTYRKAQQVSVVMQNMFTVAKKLQSTVAVGGIGGTPEQHAAAQLQIKEALKDYPTMESLFGSMDFCECEHCRSVLSPAAYLVDLMQFIDIEPKVWESTLTQWREDHDNKDYETGYNYKKPYKAFIERRPDIPYILLNCENTNTALPYIDLVNEILEYYVANQTLIENAAHDTGYATTAELLAEPQNVIAEAYTKLEQAHYPLNLPFNLWLETARSFCNYFETPLYQLLETFRPSDELFAPDQPYDRCHVFMESLGLSSAEYAIFIDPNPRKEWYKLYGYESAKNATDDAFDPQTRQRIDLNSAKALSRRLGVTYKELVEIISTRFVNPKLSQLAIIYKLNITIQDVVFYQNYKAFYAAHKKLFVEQKSTVLEKDRSSLSPAQQLQFDNLTNQDNATGKTGWEIIKEIKAIKQKLDDFIVTQYPYFDYAKIEEEIAKVDGIVLDQILVLADPNTGCDFDLTILCYASSKKADDIAFLKINLFVRLWRKLGWTIEEVDCALQAFIPESTPFEVDHLDKSPFKTALIYIAHVKALDAQLRIGKQNRLKLLTLWSDLNTSGKNSLYTQLFLTRKILKNDSVFDDPLGRYLSETSLQAIAQTQKYEASLTSIEPNDKIVLNTSNVSTDLAPYSNLAISYDELLKVQHLTYQGILSDADRILLSKLSPSPIFLSLLESVQTRAKEFILIKEHLLALQGALNLTADEVDHILIDSGESLDTAALSLKNVSQLYRYGLLVKALQLSIADLITLKHISGINPFQPLYNNENGTTLPLSSLANDYPFNQTLRFVEVVKQIKDSGFKIEDLNYLLRHRFDPVGKYRPNSEANLNLLKTLSDGVRKIRADLVPSNLAKASEDLLRQKLSPAFPSNIADTFFAMINGTAEFTAVRSTEVNLDPAKFTSPSPIRQVSYNQIKKEQKLIFRGVLFDAEKKRLTDQYSTTESSGKQLLSNLLGDIQLQQKEFFNHHLRQFFNNYNQLLTPINSRDLAAGERGAKLIRAFALNFKDFTQITLTDDWLNKNLKLILPEEVANTFLKVWDGSISYTAIQQGVEPADKIDENLFTNQNTNITVSYNAAEKTQQLTFIGALSPGRNIELRSTYKLQLLTSLLDDVQNQVETFYQKYLTEFFTPDTFYTLFDDSFTLEVRRAHLEQAFFLYALFVDPNLFTTDLLPSEFSSEADKFLKMWKGEIAYEAIQKDVEPADKIDDKLFTNQNIIVSYNPQEKQQTLKFTGVLLDAQSTELKKKCPSPLFATLLDDVQKQAITFYEQHLADVFANRAFNALFAPLPNGLNTSLKQSLIQQRQTMLTKALLPSLQQRLVQEFVVQTLTAQTGAETALVETLITDAKLLKLPEDNQSLLSAFATAGEQGLKATFFDSSGNSVNLLNTLPYEDADTRPYYEKATFQCVRFEGYLEVPVSGAYRFYMRLNKIDDRTATAKAEFELNLNNLFLQGVATDSDPEVSEYFELKAGVLYKLIWDAKALDNANVCLLVQGETLSKGNLKRLALYPSTVAEHIERANVLLGKVLQLLRGLNLNEREIRYLLTHAADFGSLNLGQLPTRIIDDIPARSQSLFEQFLRLLGYVRLRQDMVGGTDELIRVFEANDYNLLLFPIQKEIIPTLLSQKTIVLKNSTSNSTSDAKISAYLIENDTVSSPIPLDLTPADLGMLTFPKNDESPIPINRSVNIKLVDKIASLCGRVQVYRLITNLTRRDEVTVKATAQTLFTPPNFKNELSVQRLWDALQVVERFGVLVTSIVRWTQIINGSSDQCFAIARDLKEAIKARFEPETWQRVAQPIFDKLRQRQRDALVGYVMQQKKFTRMEQLYEYFLIDPGMEPVVQTSRIRLAISSVQLFIQRCLHGMEKYVPPSVLDANQWEWMKRYRVWEANRKIFLYPENWLEPEFRDDKTHLFKELEGNLLQGDISSDFVEDTFLNYLKKLDELARLDIVTMHLEDNDNPACSILHVIGRTYTEPHKFFYRRYVNQAWTPWEPVTAEVEGDHLAPVVWRGRLYLFWVSFMEKAEQPIVQNNKDAKVDESGDLTKKSLSQISNQLIDLSKNRTVEVYLHWSEYLQGEWSTHESSGFRVPTPIFVNSVKDFDKNKVFIHISKEPYENGEERGVYIHVHGDIQQSFYMAGRNSQPEKSIYHASQPLNPYVSSVQANRYSGSNTLVSKLTQRIQFQEGKVANEQPDKMSLTILQKVNNYTILPCNSAITLAVPDTGSLDESNPTAQLIKGGAAEIESLIKPIFYQDNTHTFFVEPHVKEPTIDEWQEWATRIPPSERKWNTRDWWKDLVLIPHVPLPYPPVVPIPNPSDPIEQISINPESLVNIKVQQDWLMNENTGLYYDGALIGPKGDTGLQVLSLNEATTAFLQGRSTPVHVQVGSSIAASSVVVAPASNSLATSGLKEAAGGLNVIGNGGFNAALAQNFFSAHRFNLAVNAISRKQIEQ